MRVIASLVLVGLLAACQGNGTSAGVAPPASAAASPRQVESSPSAKDSATSIPTPIPTLTGWGQLSPLPTPRSEVAAVAFARATIYVIGGLGGPRVVERYVVLSQAWDRQPDLPIPVDHAMAAAVVGGTRQGIFAIGGYSEGTATDRVFRLGLGAQSWEEVAPMPAPRAAAAAVAVGQRIYVVGGARDASTLHNSTYVYDVEANRWSIAADIPTPRDHLAAMAVGTVICAVGGRTLNMTRNLGTLECYDPAANAWRKYPNMPNFRGGLGAAAVGNKIVALGGERPAGTFKEVEVFDLTTGTWSRGQDLPHPRHGLGVVAIDRVIYAIGGATRPGGGSETGIVEFWNLP